MNKKMASCIPKHWLIGIACTISLLCMPCQAVSSENAGWLTESDAIQISEKILSNALGRSVEYSIGHCTFSLEATYYPDLAAWNVHQIGKYNGEMYYGASSYSPYVVLDAQTGEIIDISLFPMAEKSVFPLSPSAWIETPVYGNLTTSNGEEILNAVLHPEYGNPCYLLDSLITAINGTVVFRSSSEIRFLSSDAVLFIIRICEFPTDEVVLSMHQGDTQNESLAGSWDGKMDAFSFHESIYISNNSAGDFLLYFEKLLHAGENDNRNAYIVEVHGFQDVSLCDWYGKSIYALSMQNIIFGYTDQNYYPLRPISRAEFVSMLARCSGENLSIYSKEQPAFVDTGDSDMWWHACIQWAYHNGIVSGIGSAKFTPEAPISRQEAAVILSRYLKYKGMHLSVLLPLSFEDSGFIGSWAVQSVEQCKKYGIFEGTNEGLFLPQKVLTRGEAACIVWRVCSVSPMPTAARWPTPTTAVA